MSIQGIIRHPAKTSAGWSLFNKALPNRVLCFEIVGENDVRMKLGDGRHMWAETPYVGTEVDLSNYFNKSEVNAAILAAITNIGNTIRVVGKVDSENELPTENNEIGDVYFVKGEGLDSNTYEEYIWTQNGTWEHIGSTTMDMSEYYSKDEIDVLLANKISYTPGKQLSTEDYTTLEKQKLNDLKLYRAGMGISIDNDGEISLASTDANLEYVADLVRMTFPQVELTGDAWAKFTATNGNRIIEGELDNDGKGVAKLPELGTWTITSGDYSKEIVITAPMQQRELDLTAE